MHFCHDVVDICRSLHKYVTNKFIVHLFEDLLPVQQLAQIARNNNTNDQSIFFQPFKKNLY